MSETSPQVPTVSGNPDKYCPRLVQYHTKWYWRMVVCRRHQNHVRPRQERGNTELTSESTDISPTAGESTSVPGSGSLPGSDATPVTAPDSSPDAEQDSNSEEQSKYPSRDRHPLDRYESTL